MEFQINFVKENDKIIIIKRLVLLEEPADIKLLRVLAILLLIVRCPFLSILLIR